MAFRTFARQPVLTSIILATLTLGIGVTTALFSVIYGILLRPLPFHEPEKLAEVYRVNPTTPFVRDGGTSQQIELWRRGAKTLSAAAAFRMLQVSLSGGAEPRHVMSLLVSPEFFPALGVRAQFGRTFDAEDYRSDGRLLILSDRLWRTEFGGDPGIIGRDVLLDGQSSTIVGVLPARVRYPFYQSQVPGIDFDIWRPMILYPRSAGDLSAVVRLAPGSSWQQAEAELNALISQTNSTGPAGEQWTVDLRPLTELFDNVGRPLWLLVSAAGLILLIACLNVANLLLAHSVVRQKDTALRVALGAGRLRIVRQHLTDNLLLALAGGLLGLAFAAFTLGALLPLFPHRIPRIDEIGIDFMAVVFTIGVSLTAACLSAVVPALYSTRRQFYGTLAGTTRLTGGPGRTRSLDMLVAAEVGLSVVLLVGAGLLLRSLSQTLSIDLGFQPEGTLTFRLSLPEYRYGRSAQAAKAFHNLLEERLQRVPGVESVGLSLLMPLSGRLTRLPLKPESRPDEEPFQADLNIVTPGYFKSLSIGVSRGRGFELADAAGAEAVAIVSQSLAERLWPGSEPIGQRILGMAPGIDGRSRIVIGVVEDVKHADVYTESAPMVYLPYAQVDGRGTNGLLRLLTFVTMRIEGDPRFQIGFVNDVPARLNL